MSNCTRRVIESYTVCWANTASVVVVVRFIQGALTRFSFAPSAPICGWKRCASEQDVYDGLNCVREREGESDRPTVARVGVWVFTQRMNFVVHFGAACHMMMLIYESHRHFVFVGLVRRTRSDGKYFGIYFDYFHMRINIDCTNISRLFCGCRNANNGKDYRTHPATKLHRINCFLWFPAPLSATKYFILFFDYSQRWSAKQQ